MRVLMLRNFALLAVLLFRCLSATDAASQEQPQWAAKAGSKEVPALSPLLSHLESHCVRGSRNHCIAAATIKAEAQHSVGPQQAARPRAPAEPSKDEMCSAAPSQQQQQQQQQQQHEAPLKGHFSVNSKWRGWMRQHVMIVRHIILLSMAGVLSGAVYLALNIDRAPRLWPVVAWLLRIRMAQLEIERPSRVIKYKMDVYVFSRPYAKLLLLSALTSALILFGGIALYVVSDEEPSDIDGDGDDDGGGHGIFDPDGKTSFVEALWAAAAGAGFDWAFYPSTNNTVRTVSLLIAVGGSFITALLLGIVSEALGRKVDELKSGRGAVLESNHLLILGWSPKVFALLEELAMGCELSGGSTIVVLSEKDKNEMEYAIERQNIDWRGSRLVLRQGSILDVPELLNVSAHHARSILILGDLHNPSSDARTLRCMMCLQHLSNSLGTWGETQASIILELCHSDQEDLLTQIAGGPHVRTLCSPSLVGRVMVQCTRYPRLSEVLQEILGFEGNETYSCPDIRPIIGLPFRYLQAAYSQAVPLGLRKARLNMAIILNPRRDELVEEGDHVILLAEDEECLSLNPPEVLAGLHKQAEMDDMSDLNKCGPGPWHFRSFKHWQSTQQRSRQNDEDLSCPMRMTSKGEFGGRFLFVGWRKDIVSLIRQLDNFCTVPSELYLYSSTPREARRKLLNQSGLEFEAGDEGGLQSLTLKHLKLHYDEPWLVGEPTVRLQLQMLYPLQFTAILLLAQDSGGSLSVIDTDCLTVASLMNLRQIQLEDLRSGRQPVPSGLPTRQLKRGSSSSPTPADQSSELFLRRESSMTSSVSPFARTSLSRNVSCLQDTSNNARDSKSSNVAAAVAAAASAAATAVAAANPTSGAAAARVCPSAAADAAAMSMRALGLENGRPSIEEVTEAALEKCDDAKHRESHTSESTELEAPTAGSPGGELDMAAPAPLEGKAGSRKGGGMKASSLLSVASKLKTMSRQKQVERLKKPEVKLGGSAESSSSKGSTKQEKDGGKKRASLVKKKEDIESEASEVALQQLQAVVQRSTIVTELLDYSANTLLHGLQLSVKLFPNNLIAQIMALTMLSFERIDVLDYLFDAQGSKLFVRPISWLLTEEDEDISVSFLDLSQMASAQGEVLLGYTENASGAMILNPGNKTAADLHRSMLESVVTMSSAYT